MVWSSAGTTPTAQTGLQTRGSPHKNQRHREKSVAPARRLRLDGKSGRGVRSGAGQNKLPIPGPTGSESTEDRRWCACSRENGSWRARSCADDQEAEREPDRGRENPSAAFLRTTELNREKIARAGWRLALHAKTENQTGQRSLEKRIERNRLRTQIWRVENKMA
jgi:hypothetical protein